VTLIDTNILLDLFTNDPRWSAWSAVQLDRLALNGPLIINDIVYAELSVSFAEPDDVDVALARTGIALTATPRGALFLAGKAFRRYRTSGGTRTGVLPDFFIGAHATVAQLPLLTRDPRRYRSYFPTVTLISP
jgi:predicted nucleic acid-binding protein